MSADSDALAAQDYGRARVSDQDAIRALARVVNVGGDATARQTLDDYLAQEDVVPAAEQDSDTTDDGDQGDSGGEGGNAPKTRAELRAAQQGK